MNDWTIYPAIDLRHGRVVRLRQGDPQAETEYATDPLAVARHWQGAGAEWLHVVNLDGAFGEHSQKNQEALARIVTTGLHVQFGGGLRDLEAIHRAIDLGVNRAIIGTAAVQNPALVEAALAAFGTDRVALAIDAQDGSVCTHGWQRTTEIAAVEMAGWWADRGVRWVIVTDVSRDGMGRGLNVTATAQLARTCNALRDREHRLHVIASGGVAGLQDVWQACRAGLSGVIIGRALYERHLTLEEALSVKPGFFRKTRFLAPAPSNPNHSPSAKNS